MLQDELPVLVMAAQRFLQIDRKVSLQLRVIRAIPLSCSKDFSRNEWFITATRNYWFSNTVSTTACMIIPVTWCHAITVGVRVQNRMVCNPNNLINSQSPLYWCNHSKREGTLFRSASFYLPFVVLVTYEAPDDPSSFLSIIFLGTFCAHNKMQFCLQSFPLVR